MKKTWKIAIISVISLLVAILISVSVLLWIVFTPAKLTPIVSEQINKQLNCTTEIGSVELTFFSTFPEFGLKIENFKLINPMKGTSNDTVLNSRQLVATIDFDAFWNRDEIIVHKIQFNNLNINAFINTSGRANFDVYQSDSKDTSKFENPFKIIDIQRLSFKNANIAYNDLSSKMHSDIKNLNGDINFLLKNEMLETTLKLNTPVISLSMDSVDYLKKANINLASSFQYQINDSKLSFTDTELILNGLIAKFDGKVSFKSENGDIYTDLKLSTEKYDLEKLIAFVPQQYTTALKGIILKAKTFTNATIKGIYNDKSMPVVQLNATIENGSFKYPDLPIQLHDIFGNVDIHIDMNNAKASNVYINNSIAKTDQSSFEATGIIDYILDEDMLVDMNLNMILNLLEFKSFLPSDMPLSLSGYANGTSSMKFMLSDAMNMNLEKMYINGDFDTRKLNIKYDSLSMYSDNSKLKFKIPNKNKQGKLINTSIWCDKLTVLKGRNTEAKLQNVNLKADMTDISKTEQMNNILCDFSSDLVSANVDNMSSHLESPKGKLALKMNISDTVSVPNMKCDYNMKSFTASMDTMTLHTQYPKGTFSMQGDPKQMDQMLIDLVLNSSNSKAQNGNQIINAKGLLIDTKIAENKKEQNAFLKWTPTGTIEMTDGTITADGLNADVEIPILTFDFKNNEYIIKDSKFIVDNSDFKLIGKLWNVSEYLNDKGLLKGDFNFSSNRTDVYRLMELTNGFGEVDTTSIIVAENQSSNATITELPSSTGPYMVPKGMDLKLHAQINKVLLGYDSAKNVIGDLYIKDGLLALEDMRFVTSAAKMQLTAMYRTPRKNHLYVGMDFHIIDMEIGEMLKMIPDIDTIMPMLRSFGGKGEFHIAVETYLDSLYNMKQSTLRGVSSVKGENLTLMDGETFSEIAKTLRFSKNTVNKVDSLSAEFTIFKNEVDIYPFLLVMDKYKAVVSGRHNLDMTFDYHISVTDSPFPVKLGINIKGNLDKMKYTLAKCKYANLYRPVARKEIDTKQLEIRKIIRDALTKEVIVK